MNLFMKRHSLLTTQTSQVIKHVIDESTEEGLQIFTWGFIKHVTERKMTDDCISNMEKTGFAQHNKTRNFISVIGSKNGWSKSLEASFHMTIVACVSANGFSVTLIFIIPGQQ